MTVSKDLLDAAYKVIEEMPNATRAVKEKLRKEAAELDEPTIRKFIEDQRSNNAAATEAAATAVSKELKPDFEVPLKELNPGKAGVSDLFEKTNEIIKYLNALKEKPEAK